jgi:hypothetical protein
LPKQKGSRLGAEPITATGFILAAIAALAAWWRESRKQGDDKLDMASSIALSLADRLNTEARQAREDSATLRGEFEAHKAKAEAEYGVLRVRMRKCEEDREVLFQLAHKAGVDTSHLTP